MVSVGGRVVRKLCHSGLGRSAPVLGASDSEGRGSLTSSHRHRRCGGHGGSCGGKTLCRNCRPSWLICVTWDNPGDARWLVSVEPELGCRVGREVMSATHIEGGGHQADDLGFTAHIS